MRQAASLALLLAVTASAAGQKAVGKYEYLPTPTPAQAVAVAEADSRKLPAADALFCRYVWVSDSEKESVRAASLTINYTSHASTIARPVLVEVGPIMVVRIDLRSYAPKLEQLEQFLHLWEDYANDPKFSILVTRDILANIRYPDDKVPVVKVKKKFRKRVERSRGEDRVEWRTENKSIYHPGGDYVYPDDSGRVSRNLGANYYTVELKFKKVVPGEVVFEFVEVEEVIDVKITEIKDVELVRLPPEHVDPAQYNSLVSRLRTTAPIISHDYWVCRHLATVKDDGLFAELYGGRYYEFMLYRREGKGTDEDRILEDLGIGNIDAGVTADKLFDKLRSDQRIAVFKSGVTSRPRRADFFRSPAGRDGTGLVSITHDLLKKDIDIAKHPVMNLLKFKDAGREGISERANGLHGFWITNGVGVLQNVAPQALVEDHEIPVPYTRELQCAISCIRCHGIGKADGWKLVENDAKKLLADKIVDVFGDVTEPDRTTNDSVDRIAGLYSGDPEARLLPRARDDYARAVLGATGPWPQSKDQVNVVSLAAERLAKIWGDRNYKMVGPRQALLELGLVVQGKDDKEKDANARAVLRLLLPPVVEEGVLGIVPEDPRVAALRAGLSVNRVDWDLIYGFVAPRAQKSLASLKGGDK